MGLECRGKAETTEQKPLYGKPTFRMISTTSSVIEGRVRLQGPFGRFRDLAALPDPPCRKCGQPYPPAKNVAIFLVWAARLVCARIVQIASKLPRIASNVLQVAWAG